MYLKALEISGFKSFADRTRITLRPGTTCIVGPNGCGKSNVVDALRWCVGEMSWKSLRMPSMLDVIFAGTTKRPPVNMGTVSMTFDNTDKKLPLNFSEVTVTRKIYRSEESEYFINKVQCRLKDIRELFLDTGIGTDGYAIIDQGEVEQVLNATEEQRREMFEEAAGVSKYKAKRDEALKRLEKTEADLARLSDSTLLLKEQIKKLESEAKKACLRNKYKEELRKAEIILLLQEKKAASAKAEELGAVLEKTDLDLAGLKEALAKKTSENSAAIRAAAEKRDKLARLREEINGIKLKINTDAEKRNSLKALLDETAAAALTVRAREKSNAEKTKRTEALIDELQTRLSSEENSLPDIKRVSDEAQKKTAEAENELGRYEQSLSGAEKELNSSYAREVTLSNYISETSSDIKHFREEISASGKDLDTLGKSSAALAEKLSELQEHAGKLSLKKKELNSRINAYAGQLDGAGAEMRKLSEVQSEIKEKKAALGSRLEIILAQAEKDSYWTGTRKVLDSGSEGIKGLLRDMLEIPEECSAAAEDALGDFLDYVVCDSFSCAEKAASYLNKHGRGRCRFLIADRFPETADRGNAENSLVDKIKYAPVCGNIIRTLLAGSEYDGETARGRFWLAGGSSQINSNEPYWEETGKLKKALAELNCGLAETERKKNALAAESAELAAAAASAKESEKAITAEIFKNGSELASVKQSLEINSKRIKLTESVVYKSGQGLGEAEAKLKKLNSESEAAKKTSEEKKALIQKIQTEKEKLHLEYARLKGELGTYKANLANRSNSMEMVRQELSRASQELSALNADRKECAAGLSALGQKETKIRNSMTETAESAAGLEKNAGEKEEALRREEAETAEIAGEAEKSGAGINDMRILGAELEKNRVKTAAELQSCEEKIKETERRLKEEWNTGGTEEEIYAGLSADRETVSSLRKKIENMGAVNMTAPEELEAVNGRYGFLDLQQKDLNRAKSDLREAINKINTSTRENFKNTFELVKKYFKEIYSLLFNGGEADLVLTDPGDLLETGIEIIASPPGKKPRSISQLSGGEKALTALSLLFSFFRVNPAPFCVMDEADAPLDEANVERFVKLIREFSSGTQFIIITHNKRTMEAAETLYGVTMEEMGVSKLISVDLKMAEDMTSD